MQSQTSGSFRKDIGTWCSFMRVAILFLSNPRILGCTKHRGCQILIIFRQPFNFKQYRRRPQCCEKILTQSKMRQCFITKLSSWQITSKSVIGSESFCTLQGSTSLNTYRKWPVFDNQNMVEKNGGSSSGTSEGYTYKHPPAA